jgi:dipeptidyl aminopeptidase/acylaminoacyl peptidase
MPLLIVHGDVDKYFPVEHAYALENAIERAGNANATMIVVEGFGHAETAISAETLTGIGEWLRSHVPHEQNGAKG